MAYEGGTTRLEPSNSVALASGSDGGVRRAGFTDDRQGTIRLDMKDVET